MGASWDTERGTKAAAWFTLYVTCWLLMQASCKLKLPPNCRQSYEPMDVLIELPFLLAFALGQAFMCDILDSERYHSLSNKRYLPVIIVASGLITSALMTNDDFVDIHVSRRYSMVMSVFSIILIVVFCLVFVYHLFLGWKRLPGAEMISQPDGETAQIREGNRYLQYMIKTILITTYVALYATFAYRRGDGWEYHYIPLAWCASLIASFDTPISVVWLAVTTGTFLQGVGAYSFQFLFHSNE